MAEKPGGTEASAAQREQAAFLIAEDRLTDQAIATKVGIGLRTLGHWKTHKAFAARVQALREQMRAHVYEQGIADKAVRLADYDDLRRRLWSTIAARGESAEAARAAQGDLYGRMPAPGAEYGLMVKRTVPGGKGLEQEWAVDTAVIAELRALDKQAAQEAGQWTEKRELTGKDGGPLDVTDSRAELLGRLAQLAARAGAPGGPGHADGGGGGPPAL